MAAHSRNLTWEIPWTEEPGGLQSTGSQRVGHDRTAEHTNTASLKRLKKNQKNKKTNPMNF